MSARIEKLISEYPQMVSQKKCLAYQVAHFRGLSPEDVIASMYTAHHDGERVQTSGTSDKTAQIALNYESRMARLNREWYEHLEKELVELLSGWQGIPITYAGGIGSLEDLKEFEQISRGRLDFTIGSALDLFGGTMEYTKVLEVVGSLAEIV